MTDNYFHLTLADVDGISGDDLNRRHRENRLGFKAPSADWANSGNEIRCIYERQIMHRAALDNADIYVHATEAYFEPLDSDGNPMIAPIRVIG